MSEQRNTELGEFLRARRAELSPSDTGVATYGSARRVPGLRRPCLRATWLALAPYAPARSNRHSDLALSRPAV